MTLVTDYVKVAQSGKTIDGRTIDAKQLKQMADNYDKAVYTAMVFPNHDHNYQAYGTVEALQVRDEGDSVVGLYAKIAPNAFWQSDIRYGQNVFTSVEIMPNFAASGEAYLTGLGATNNPASLGVAQLNFSVEGKLYTDALPTVFTEEPAPSTSIFSRFKKETPVKLEDYQELKAKVDHLSQKMAALNKDPDPAPAAKPDPASDEKYTALEQENAAFKSEIAALKNAAEKRDNEFTEMKTLIETFGAQLQDALKEQPGTASFKDGQADDSRSYI
jgi:hypothetical protein